MNKDKKYLEIQFLAAVEVESRMRNGRGRCFICFARGKAAERGVRQAEASSETDEDCVSSVSHGEKRRKGVPGRQKLDAKRTGEPSRPFRKQQSQSL